MFVHEEAPREEVRDDNRAAQFTEKLLELFHRASGKQRRRVSYRLSTPKAR